MASNPQVNPYAPPQAELDDVGTGADTTFTLNLFSAEGRIGRVRLLGYSMGLSLLVMLVGGALALISPWLFAPAYVFMIYVQVMLTIKRCHDFNMSGWLTLLIFVPIANLIFLFVPGTDGPNRFGNKTAPNGSAAVVVILLVVAMFLIGILAAIALPAYKTYTDRARAAQAQAQMR
jgi:uncharacterized membrane protein YhaH (DUF805 family)